MDITWCSIVIQTVFVKKKVATTINFTVVYWLSTNIYGSQASLNISCLPLESLPHSLNVRGRKSRCLTDEQLWPQVIPWVSSPHSKHRAFTQTSSNTTQDKGFRFHPQQRLWADIQRKVVIMTYDRSRTWGVSAFRNTCHMRKKENKIVDMQPPWSST